MARALVAGLIMASVVPDGRQIVRAMFSGIVEEMGAVSSLVRNDAVQLWDGSVGEGVELTVKAKTVLEGAAEGCSIAVNGVCLTVTSFDGEEFKVGLAPETLRRSNLEDLHEGDGVNLERALPVDGRNSGHFVQGHVDDVGTILSMEIDQDSLVVKVEAPQDLMRYIVPKGFIAVDGTSLTVCEVNVREGWFTFMLVAYTQQHIIIPNKRYGDKVNLEVDVLGKYVERSLTSVLDRLGALEAWTQASDAKTASSSSGGSDTPADVEYRIGSIEHKVTNRDLILEAMENRILRLEQAELKRREEEGVVDSGVNPTENKISLNAKSAPSDDARVRLLDERPHCSRDPFMATLRRWLEAHSGVDRGSMKPATKASRRRRSDAIQQELLSLRAEAHQAAAGSSLAPERTTSTRERVDTGSHHQHHSTLRHQRVSKQGRSDRRSSAETEEVASHSSAEKGHGHLSSGLVYAGAASAAATADDFDSYGEEDEAPPSGRSPRMPMASRLALAEEALAEMTAQRDQALEQLEAFRRDNAYLREELQRARSYKALYAAAHEEHKGMKASLAASTQICMGQQKLIQMLQASSSTATASALEGEGFPSASEGVITPPPPSPPRQLRKSGRALEAGSRGVERRKEAERMRSFSPGPVDEHPSHKRTERRGVGHARIGSDSRPRTSGPGGRGAGGGGDSGDIEYIEEGKGEAVTHARSRALFAEEEAFSLDARQEGAMRAATVAGEAATREGLNAVAAAAAAAAAAAVMTGDSVTGGRDRGGRGAGHTAESAGGGGGRSRRGGESAGASSSGGSRRAHLLDDDLISHSSLRREYDETFLNQPLRGEHRRGEQHWSYAAGTEDVAERGEEATSGADLTLSSAAQARSRGGRIHGREGARTKSGSQSSVSTVASTNKSTKGTGMKDDSRPRKAKSERHITRDGSATALRGARGTSPRPSASRQARVVQRLSSGSAATATSSLGAGAAGAPGGSAGSGHTMALADARDPGSRRGSSGSAGRVSSRKLIHRRSFAAPIEGLEDRAEQRYPYAV